VRVRLGLLREFLREALYREPKNAEMDTSMGMDEEAVVPGRWAPNGLEAEPYDHERLGDPTGLPSGAEGDLDEVGDDRMYETDDRMLGDGKGNGMPDPEDPDDLKISPHLRGDEEKTSLGDPPEEKPESLFGESAWLVRESHAYMQQRRLLTEYPPGAGMVDPVDGPKGFYTDYDAAKDHGDGDYIQSPWYQTPARPVGTDGDIRREEDPAAQLKMHPSDNDPTTVHPSLVGKEGFASLNAPEIPELSGGGDTSTMLGANAKPGGEDVGSDSESEEGEEGEGQGGESDQAQGEEQG